MITLLFPGQGSQHPGMGRDLYEKFDVVKHTFEQASQTLGYDVAELCFKKPKLGSRVLKRRDLNKTIYTQPAVLTTSYACFRAFEQACEEYEIDLDTSLLAGHSLGEYTAVTVSGAVDFETSLDLVKKRATYMTELGKTYPGAGLMALMNRNGGLDYDRIDALCRDFEVHVTLNNTKRQIVVGGSKKQLAEMSKKLKSENVFTKMLNVEGPFHTPMMKPAAVKLRKAVENSAMSIASKPIIANVSTEAIVDPTHIRNELYEQVFQVVDWRRSIEKAIGNGGNIFIEIGPKKVLTNMLKDIDPSIETMNVEDMESLGKTVKALAGND